MQLPCDREHDMKTKFLKVSSSVSKQYEYFFINHTIRTVQNSNRKMVVEIGAKSTPFIAHSPCFACAIQFNKRCVKLVLGTKTYTVIETVWS